MGDGARLLAIGDVHLGTRCSGIPHSVMDWGIDPVDLKPAAPLERCVDLAIDRKVAAVLLAGDVVDSSNAHFEAMVPFEACARRLLDAPIDLLAIFTSLWNEGRNRPVDRDSLHQSKAVSGHNLEPLVTIAESLAGDPRALLDALRSNRRPALARFRTGNADDLEAWLRDHGYLDERPRMTREELTLRALASPPAARLPTGARSRVHRWWFLAEGAPPA